MSAQVSSEPADPLLSGIHRLQAMFDAKIRYDEVRERLVESMSEELTAHRQGLLRSQLRPVLVDLVTMYDDLTKWSDAANCPPATATALLYFRDTVEQTLARNGVEAFTVEGNAVDRVRQKVISVVETTDPAVDRQVAERLRPGFSWHDKVLRPEWVTAFVADPEHGDTADPTDTTDLAQPDTTDGTRLVVEEGAPN